MGCATCAATVDTGSAVAAATILLAIVLIATAVIVAALGSLSTAAIPVVTVAVGGPLVARGDGEPPDHGREPVAAKRAVGFCMRSSMEISSSSRME